MGAIFSAPKAELPPPPPPAEKVVAEDRSAALAAGERERARQRRLRGRQADIVSGPSGLKSAAKVAKKTLLGE